MTIEEYFSYVIIGFSILVVTLIFNFWLFPKSKKKNKDPVVYGDDKDETIFTVALHDVFFYIARMKAKELNLDLSDVYVMFRGRNDKLEMICKRKK